MIQINFMGLQSLYSTPSLSRGAVSESWRAEWGLGIPSTWRQGGASKVHVRRHRTDVLRRCPGACVGLGLVGEKADPLGQGHPAAGWTPGPDSWEVAPLLSRQ